MEAFLRRTFSLTRRQMEYLKNKADDLGTSIADVLRRIIDEHMDKR